MMREIFMQKAQSASIILVGLGIISLVLGMLMTSIESGLGVLGGCLFLSGLNLMLFRNLRMHIDIDHRQISAVQSAIALSRVNMPNPVFFINHAVSPDFVEIVAEVIRRMSVCNVLELGSGTSSTYIVALLSQIRGSGTLISLEENQDWATLVQSELDTMVKADSVTAQVCFAPLIPKNNEFLPFYDVESVNIEALGPFDLMIVDGPGDVCLRRAAFSILGTFLSPSGIIILDDGDQEEIQESISSWVKQNPSWTAKYYATVKGTWVLWDKSKILTLPLP
jgi:hypothetical protein